MEKKHADWALEDKHLAEILAIVREKWQTLTKSHESGQDAITDAQEEVQELISLDVGGLYSAQGFLDLLELSQAADSVVMEMRRKQDEEQQIRALSRMLKVPYFARIDFAAEDRPVRQVYIGRSTLMEDDPLAIHVFDWRSPIASLFYQHGVGEASYEAPSGKISGKISLKRQYEIKKGELKFFFDADEQVHDAFLRQMLSRPAEPGMKSIVETIQRDQDLIIRDLSSELLMVQGAAGSGKTSIALHRVAYLMYQGLKESRLSPQDILILSPNTVFERYISQVLPDLGERQVQTALFDDLIETLLPGENIQPRSEFVEKWLSVKKDDQKKAMRSSRAIKRSAEWIKLLDRLVWALPRMFIPFDDVYYDGICIVKRELLKAEILLGKKIDPVGARLKMLEKPLWDRVHALYPQRFDRLLAFAYRFPEHSMAAEVLARQLSIAESGALARRIEAFTRVDCSKLYKEFLSDKEKFAKLAKDLFAPSELEEVRAHTLDALAGGQIPYDDALSIAYLTAKVHGIRSYRHIKQLVLDEAQDTDALHITLLALLFPNARFTVLGDIHQTLIGSANASLYPEIERILGKKTNTFVTLEKSFRSTREIWALSRKFLPADAPGECFSRSGAMPTIEGAEDEAAQDALMADCVGDCIVSGCKTVALIARTEAEAVALHAQLSGKIDIKLIRNDELASVRGAFIIPLYMAKGLEFDAVLLPDVDEAHYHNAEDLGLLYVGATRALHRLHIFYAGRISPLLPCGEEEQA